MDTLDFEITTDEIQTVAADETLNIFLKKNDILQIDNFEFKNATRLKLDKFKDCDGFNRVYIYDKTGQIGLLREEDKLFLEKICDTTDIATNQKGRLLRLSDTKFDMEKVLTEY
jgi:hypothetical protein